MQWIITSQEEGIRTIILNRPEKLNALFGTMRQELLEALDAAAADDEVNAVVITGEGRGFCAGGDVEFMSNLQKEKDIDGFRALLDAGAAVVRRIRSLPKPIIAAVNGVAAGAGCNLAIACDYRVASEQARFAQSFVKIGVHPDWGGTWFLPRLIGPSRAMEMMMTGRLVDADEAHQIGLVDRLVSAARLKDSVNELARTIANGPPLPIADIKRAIQSAERLSLDEQLELETENQIRAFLSADAAEGMKAFFEKRSPVFRGA